MVARFRGSYVLLGVAVAAVLVTLAAVLALARPLAAAGVDGAARVALALVLLAGPALFFWVEAGRALNRVEIRIGNAILAIRIRPLRLRGPVILSLARVSEVFVEEASLPLSGPIFGRRVRVSVRDVDGRVSPLPIEVDAAAREDAQTLALALWCACERVRPRSPFR